MVIKADAYASHLENAADKRSVVSVLTTATKLVGTDTLEEFAQKIIRLHRPGKFNYVGKFGIDENAVQPVQAIAPPPPAAPIAKEDKKTTTIKTCEQCSVEIEEKVAYYCRINKAKFNGKMLCQACQKAPAPLQTPTPQPATENNGKNGSCESCNAVVDSKVVFFCRMNKKKFDSKILCRDCQQKHS
jgi:hypothetical protein